MHHGQQSETWSSRLGVILAVAGSAVGLGNFLRFPGLAAQYGSGAFMIAYFISLLLLGIPIGWTEWTLGRQGGQQGYRSSPGIFHALLRHPVGKYVGVLGVVVPVGIAMYYLYIESWCLGYAWHFLTGRLSLGNDVAAYDAFWQRYVGAARDGQVFTLCSSEPLLCLGLVLVMNIAILYRGLVRGIELFCRYAMPALILLGLIVLVRVLTLGTPDPAHPDRSVLNGLGYMWNPGKPAAPPTPTAAGDPSSHSAPAADVTANPPAAPRPPGRQSAASLWSQLRNPQLWLAAAGQIFFSLGVGFGIIITYAAYLRRRDDVVLSSLTASATNEFCEVALGGLITVPAAFVFLGSTGVAGQGTFALGFKVLPLVFARMPWPALLGTAWFLLLFLAAITSSIAMLQAGIAFLEEGLGLNRRQSTAALSVLATLGALFVAYYSRDLKALDTLDFWVGTFLIFLMATILLLTFGWVVGLEKCWAAAHQGAAISIPGFFKPIIKYVAPLYLLGIFALWILFNVLGWDPDAGAFKATGYILDLTGSSTTPPNSVARYSVALILGLAGFTLLAAHFAGRRWTASTSRKTQLERKP